MIDAPGQTAACAAALMDVMPALGRILIEVLQSEAQDDRLTPTQYKVLWYVNRQPRVSSDLARFLGVTPASITTTVDVMVNRGLVERLESPSDRRCVHVRITPAGQARLEDVCARMRARVDMVVAPLAERHRDQLVEGLGALRAVLERQCAVRQTPRPHEKETA